MYFWIKVINRRICSGNMLLHKVLYLHKIQSISKVLHMNSGKKQSKQENETSKYRQGQNDSIWGIQYTLT